MADRRGVTTRHAHMVDDPMRTKPLLSSVGRAVRKGDVVVDIGTGLGILARAAARGGAKKVFAIECDSDALAEARRLAADEKMQDKIEFICGLSFDIDLPEKADLIICETIGSFAFDENILATLKDAKRRFLKPGGKIIPKALELWGAPLSHVPHIEEPTGISEVRANDMAGDPVLIKDIDFSSDFSDSIHRVIEFECKRKAHVRAFALWPKVVWWSGEFTDASPLRPPTHWKQGILPIEEKRATKGRRLTLELIIEPHPDDPYTMTERLWRWRD